MLLPRTPPHPPSPHPLNPHPHQSSQLINRYGIGTDREEESKVDRALEEDDKKKMADATWEFDGQVRAGLVGFDDGGACVRCVCV
jgi:hypothetical protein